MASQRIAAGYRLGALPQCVHYRRLRQSRSRAAPAGRAVAPSTAATGLRTAAEDYLSIRRAFGFKLTYAGRLVSDSVDYLEASAPTESPGACPCLSTTHRCRPGLVESARSTVRGHVRRLQNPDSVSKVPSTGVLPAAPPSSGNQAGGLRRRVQVGLRPPVRFGSKIGRSEPRCALIKDRLGHDRSQLDGAPGRSCLT